MRSKFIILLLLTGILNACGQIGNHKHQTLEVMKYDVITNPIAKEAIKAWQEGDLKKWLSFFTENAQLLDDGKFRDFLKFSTEAIN